MEVSGEEGYISVRDVTDSYFFEMLSDEALKIAEPFIKEERAIIESILQENVQDHKKLTFVGVGVGPCLHLDVVLPYCRYIGIDPLLKFHVPPEILESNNCQSTIQLLSQDFNKVKLKRNNEYLIIAFVFNLIAYFSNYIEALNRNIAKGDIIIISTWRRSNTPLTLRERYFSHINKKTNQWIIEKKNFGVLDLATIRVDQIKYYKHHKIIQGEYCEIIIIYL